MFDVMYIEIHQIKIQQGLHDDVRFALVHISCSNRAMQRVCHQKSMFGLVLSIAVKHPLWAIEHFNNRNSGALRPPPASEEHANIFFKINVLIIAKIPPVIGAYVCHDAHAARVTLNGTII